MRSYRSKVQCFSNPDSNSNISSPLSNQCEQSFEFKLKNRRQLQGSQVSKILEASMVAQKMGLKVTMEAISSTSSNNLDWKFMNWYLDSTLLSLDALNNIQLRLERIRSFINLIAIGLHYLEGEHELSWVVLQRAIGALEESMDFQDKQQYNKKEKAMYRKPTFGKKLCDGKFPNLYKILSGSLSMAVFAIEVLQFAMSSVLRKELSNKKGFPRKANESASMEELAKVDLAVQAMLKLISGRKTCGDCSLQRMAVAGELKKRKEELEKILLLFEEKIGELYKVIVAIRINMLELLSKAQKGVVLKIVKTSNYEESQMDANLAHTMGIGWVNVKTKLSARSCSIG